MPTACPLCGGSRQATATLSTSSLVAAYRRQFGIDVARCFGDTRMLSLLQCESCRLEGFDPPVTGDAEFYRSLSAWWDAHVPGHSSIERKPEYRRALRYIKPSDRLLEVGGGSLVLPRHLGGSRYVGLELNPDSVEEARRMGFDVRRESVELHARSNPAGYDIVCHFQVIEHVAAPHDFIEACLACLRPGGLLIVACPNNRSFLAVEPDNILNMPPHHVTWFSRIVLEWIAAHWGLCVREIAEEPLEPSERRTFASLMWLHMLGRFWRSSERFTLDGKAFRMARLVSGAMARLTAPLLAGMANAIPGHTIMAVYQKPLAVAGTCPEITDLA
jgi:SAM-dependent methyltransferase